MRAATFSIFTILGLAQCAFGLITINKPSSDKFGTGTCTKVTLNTQSLTGVVRYNLIFTCETNSSLSFNVSSTFKSGIEINFEPQLETYSYYAVALDKDNNTIEASTSKTIVVSDTVCYPETIDTKTNDGSFEEVSTKSSWEVYSSVKSYKIIITRNENDSRQPHSGNTFVLMGARDGVTDQSISQKITITKEDEFIAFWSQSIVNGAEDGHFVELTLGEKLISKWTRENHRDINGVHDDANKNYSFVSVAIPEEAHTVCDNNECELKFRAYSTDLSETAGVQLMIDDVTVGTCTSFDKDDCEYAKNCSWCASQNICIGKDDSCTDCSKYTSDISDNHFGCNWAEGCWYCFNGDGHCIDEGSNKYECSKDCTISHESDNCKNCTTMNYYMFYLDMEEYCPKCSAFTKEGSASCTNRSCYWCEILESCVDNEASCGDCSSIKDANSCEEKQRCGWCAAQSTCMELKAEACPAGCSGKSQGDCSGNNDCFWCASSKTCIDRFSHELKNTTVCPLCNNTGCTDAYPGCKVAETGACIYEDQEDLCEDHDFYECKNLTCSWCSSKQKCLNKNVDCVKCDTFGNNKTECTQTFCEWCASDLICQDPNDTSVSCTDCSTGLPESQCKSHKGCCYYDNACYPKDENKDCKSDNNTLLIVIVVVCIVVVVVVAIVIIVVVVYVVHRDNKSAESIEMGGSNIVVVDSGIDGGQMADPSMMASMDPSMMTGAGGAGMMGDPSMMGGAGMMDPSMMNSGMMDPAMMNSTMMNSGMMDPSMMNSGMMGGGGMMNSGMNSGMMDPSMMNSMGMTGGMDMNMGMNSMGMTGGMDMNMGMNSMGMTGGMDMNMGMNSMGMTGGMDMNMGPQ